MAKPRTVNQLLHSGPTLRELHRRLDAQERLLGLVRGLLPEPLDRHCLAAQQQRGRLLLHTDSSAWASRLRYLSRDLRAKLRDKGILVQKVEVRVFIDSPARRRPPGRRCHLSRDSARLIEATADEIRDADLRAALKRLCRHGTA